MRNLKKVLSLALAMVMLLGMMVVGAGAATEFKDASSIPENRAVAVAVANALEVLLGDENGNFNPDKTLTRAEAAVVLTKLDLGASAANALTATNAASFDDVGTGYGWAKAYIDYCAGNGYMVGVGGNKFAPGRTLTSVEFATMVSRVLGYKDENEYGKDGWTAVKAAALARKAGLGADVAVANTDMSRADMAQMVLNALTAPMVEYTGLNGSIGDATFNSPATTRKHANDQGTNRADYKGDPIVPNITPIRLCEEKFPTLKLSTTEGDDFARTYSVWKLKNIEINGSTTKNEPDLAFNTKVTRNTAADWGKLSNLVAGRNGVSLFINGEDCTEAFDAFDVGTGSDKVTYSIVNMRPWIGYFTGAGREVEVYLNPDDLTDVEKVVVVDTALAEVTKENSDETISLKLMASQATDGNRVLSTKVGYGDVKKGDLVLVQGYGTRIIGKDTVITSVEEAPVVTGFARVKNWSSDKVAASIVMDDTTYYDAYSVMNGYNIQAFDLNDEFDSTLYLDTHGNIMKAIEGKDPKKVDDHLIAVKDFYSTLSNGKIVTMAQGVLSNGETVNWPVVDKSYTASHENKLYTWTKPDSLYDLTAVAQSDSSDATRFGTDKFQVLASASVNFKSDDIKGKGPANGYLYSDAVKFIFFNTDGVTVLNGRQNFNFTADGTKFYAQALKENANGTVEVSAVFINDTPDVINIGDIIYIHSRFTQWDEVVTNKDGKNVIYYGYKAYTSAGEEIEHFLGVDPDMEGRFIAKDLNDDGAYKKNNLTSVQNHTKLDGTVRTANGLSGDAFLMTPANGGAQIEFIGRSSAKVVDLSGEKYYIDSISELNRCVNDGNVVTVSIIYNQANSEGDTVKEALTVYVTKITKGAVVGPITGDSSVNGGVIADVSTAGKVTFIMAKGSATTAEKRAALLEAYAEANGYKVDDLKASKSGTSWTITDKDGNNETITESETKIGGVPNQKNVNDQAKTLLDSITVPAEGDPNYATKLEEKRIAQELVDLSTSGFLSTNAMATPVDATHVKLTGIDWHKGLDIMVDGYGKYFNKTLKEMYGTATDADSAAKDTAARTLVDNATHWALVVMNNKANDDTSIRFVIYSGGKIYTVDRDSGDAKVTTTDVTSAGITYDSVNFAIPKP